MRQFAEARAGQSGWDYECLAIDNPESRKNARSTLAEKISESYKEEFVRVNEAEGKGRPKANNISAAKKTVRMIAERILWSLEAKAMQHKCNEAMGKGRESEKELIQLRQIHKCGQENPSLPYDQVVALATAQLSGLLSDIPSATSMTSAAVAASVVTAGGIEGDNGIITTGRGDGDGDGVGDEAVETMKQSLVEMRADQIGRGQGVQLLDMEWARTVRLASEALVRETYSRQFVPKTKVYGCRHFTRKNRVLVMCCGMFVTCRMCHIQDKQRLHEPRIEPVQTMLCIMCGEVQSKTQTCRKCGQIFGSYYCDICGITDDTPGYDLRHCAHCNVCMPGLTFHCNKCNTCVPATPDHDAVCSGNISSGHGGITEADEEEGVTGSPKGPHGIGSLSDEHLGVGVDETVRSDAASVNGVIFPGL